jgi:glycosyltransferase A (GT-A) superfamily protein (DUF2064 family)
MVPKKHALVLFTKYPEPGLTKTRMIVENGGNLTAREAAALYQAMVLDTAAVALHALNTRLHDHIGEDEFRFCISTPPDHLPKVQEMFASAFPTESIEYLVDSGRNFDEHFDSCFRQLFQRGYRTVVCIGGDLPGITPDLVYRAFQSLMRLDHDGERGAMALAPCQAGGVSLVGITRDTPIAFEGVFYNSQGVTALDALIYIAAQKDIPVALFEALADVDYGEDLGHMISVINAMAYASRYDKGLLVPERTLEFISQNGLAAISQPNQSKDPREAIDG